LYAYIYESCCGNPLQDGSCSAACNILWQYRPVDMVMGRHEEGCDRRGKPLFNGSIGAAEGEVMAFY